MTERERIMTSLIEVKHEAEDWDFVQSTEIPTRRDVLALNYRDLLTPDSQKIKLLPLQHRRKQREQYRSNVNSLQELAAILPAPPQRREKRLTKKEILNQVLRYIAFLNKHICNTKSLLKNHYVAIDESEYYLNGEESSSPEEAAQSNTEISPPSTPPTIKKMRLRNICPKPRKKKWVEKTERRQMLKSHHCLYSEAALYDNHLETEGQREVKLTWQEPPLDTSSSSSCSQDNTVRPPGRALFLTLLELAESGGPTGSGLRNTGKYETNNDPKGSPESDERKMNCSNESSVYDPLVNSPYLSMKDQKLVHYLSSHDEDDDVDRSPWLPQESPRGGAEIHSPISDSLATSGLQATLGLSPSLFSSPGRHIQLLQDKKENLAQALFGAVCLSPELPATRPGDLKLSNAGQNQQYPNGYWNLTLKDDPDQIVPATPPMTSDSFQSTFIFDHCYLPYSETSRTDSSQADSTSSGDNSCQICPSLEKWDRHLLQEDSDESEHWLSSSDDIEDNDITWTPYCRGKFLQQTALSKQKRTRIISQGNHRKIRRKRCCTLQLKKKCVNGFIMFCRINRRLYISDHPGTASTVATKALAHVWRSMSKNERRPYCIKAREFSKMNNRIVRLDSSSSEEREEVKMPEPLHLL
ncbi:meiosis initiator protein-like isoform X1 [Carcharodon carcharias]|uniref:meiosis initiator protein-like isoform X1 n=1 Tax=Carcharodon carcharias TaxID=13397 RepID=UPI001B7DFE06|nr:meiosis initiator protein-like isoform X1 [Carcharodon carcharias]XP_041035042.1 meiosis initiator protein-like isoform X1 [Carcharodon carcharias]